ncbi:hypothetical protein LSG31_19185 [Fodinisporobacter ferrooxydans]|uniref:Uncharacterized protein n=1 Tax=Fodinisporobacter ferrooxydans TaxID=2901836 RepID=A0ABY4CHG8_9BACL|nr:hypothetical protein LSG31_19185 [Alicyclobacillaceae bacterium MYW30-H2]
MDKMFGIDYDYFSKKLLNENERMVLNTVDISLLVDPETHSISRIVYFSDIPNPKQMIEQDQIIDRFINRLYKDQEVQLLI